ncbi:MAG: NAD(P)-binding protein [Bdellovibrionia bacterium]
MSSTDRRTFILGGVAGAATLLAGTYGLRESSIVPGEILGSSSRVGHMLRDRKDWPQPSRETEIPVAIVGAGVSGLSAAWFLNRSGVNDFLVFDLEDEAGGNARAGGNHVSRYPWGAHYLPVPNEESHWVRTFLEETGVITGRDRTGRPVYDEFALCAEPAERLHIHGRWQNGLIPSFGVAGSDRTQMDAFFARIEKYRFARGRDGKPAFAIPIRESSRDSEFLALDQITMAEFLRRNGWTTPYLNWYVDYCCRDDYGTSFQETSAWAGIHYFAGRRGWSANTDHDTVLTWPEGNAWLVDRMKSGFKDRIRTSTAALRVSQDSDGAVLDMFHVPTGTVERVRARTVIWAGPRFVAERVIEGLPRAPEFSYAPWMVANITLTDVPNGAADSWDNVFYGSKSLGYVVATHQNVTPYPKETVLTYYWPLSHAAPLEARREALARPHAEWSALVLKDLRRTGIEPFVNRLDVWLWGHGMIRPTPGFIWGTERSERHGTVFFAHSDMSGISIFEEAQDQGIRAARQAARLLGARIA